MRRVLWGALLVLSVAAYLYIPAVQTAVQQIVAHVHDSLYIREVRVAGTQILSDQDLNLERFSTNNSIWWRINHSQIEREIMSNPIVATASVAPCSQLGLSCFQVRITERMPSMIAALNDRYWVLGDGGALLTSLPLEQRLFSRLEELRLQGKVIDLKDAPRIEGLLPDGASSGVLHARYEYLKGALAVIESECDKRVGSVKFHSNGELEVRFRSFSVPVIFGYANGDFEVVKKGAKRLKRILNELGPNTDNLTKIDLAMDKVVVVSTSGDSSKST